MIDSKRLTAWYDFQAPAYHLWRDDYDSPLVERVSTLLAERSVDSTRSAMDAGCGSGMFAIGLAKRLRGWVFHGVDASTGLLGIARKQAAKRNLANVTFTEGDVTALTQADASFDCVIAAGLFPNLNDHAAALRELVRVLKPDGQIVIIEFDRTAMSTGTRLFFRGMIAAYKAVSMVFRRFRFADKWNVETSTIDRQRFTTDLINAGLEPINVLQEHNHLIFHCRKRER